MCRFGDIPVVTGSLLVPLLVGACAGRTMPANPPVAVTADRCELVPAPPGSASSLAIAVTAALDPVRLWSAPNAGERFVAAHAYETLVRVDCVGRVEPGLARSWRQDSAGGRWTFALRDDIRYWSGDPVGAVEVVAGWRETAGIRDDPTTAVTASARIVDARTIALELPHGDLASLAEPAFAVRRPRVGSPWPEGTGAFRVREGLRSGAGGTTIHLDPLSEASPRLTIVSAPSRVARDLVDAGLDLLLTDAFDLASYAAGRPEMRDVPLSWNRTYVLMTTLSPLPADDTLASPEARQPSREALARNVVGGDARGATAPFWWSGVACPVQRAETPPAPAGMRIAYDRSDAVARALAERVVAMAGMSGARDGAPSLLPASLRTSGSPLTAIGLSSTEWATSLRDGREAAWVVAVPRQVPAPCYARDELALAIPWLSLSDHARVVPLIETRWHAVLRPDRLGLMSSGDGTPRVTAGGRKP